MQAKIVVVSILNNISLYTSSYLTCKEKGCDIISSPVFHVYDVQHILQQTTLKLVIRLTAGSERW